MISGKSCPSQSSLSLQTSFYNSKHSASNWTFDNKNVLFVNIQLIFDELIDEPHFYVIFVFLLFISQNLNTKKSNFHRRQLTSIAVMSYTYKRSYESLRVVPNRPPSAMPTNRWRHPKNRKLVLQQHLQINICQYIMQRESLLQQPIVTVGTYDVLPYTIMIHMSWPSGMIICRLYCRDPVSHV